MSHSKKNIYERNDWFFVPQVLSGIAGVFIGLVIANYLGWY